MTRVIAHRGASAAHPPGNTVVAFRAARELGATWVELDVRRSGDSQLVVIHEAELPDGRPVHESKRAEIPDWVPSLDEALDACEGMGVNVEIKNLPDEAAFDPDERITDQVCELVQGRDAPEVLVSSFNLATIDRVRARAPQLATAFLVLRMTDGELRAAHERGHATIHPLHRVVDAERVDRARELSLEINAWTVNDPDRMRVLAELGVDGIVSDVPDVLRGVLSELEG